MTLADDCYKLLISTNNESYRAGIRLGSISTIDMIKSLIDNEDLAEFNIFQILNIVGENMMKTTLSEFTAPFVTSLGKGRKK